MLNKKILWYFVFIKILIFADQSTKAFLISYLKTQPHYIYQLLPSLDIVYAWNYGVSFGLFSEHKQYSNIVFLITNSAIIFYLGFLLINSKNHITSCSLVLIIGGAVGNLIDRLIRGAVFDFILLYYNNLYFPAFNLADSFISIGATLFISHQILLSLASRKEKN